jgi:hypothetical protein
MTTATKYMMVKDAGKWKGLWVRSATPAQCRACRNIAPDHRMKDGICPSCQNLRRTRSLDQINGKRIPCRCVDCRAIYLTADRGRDYCPKCTRERRIAEATGRTYNKPLPHNF